MYFSAAKERRMTATIMTANFFIVFLRFIVWGSRDYHDFPETKYTSINFILQKLTPR
jgi:hypothetical protein